MTPTTQQTIRPLREVDDVRTDGHGSDADDANVQADQTAGGDLLGDADLGVEEIPAEDPYGALISPDEASPDGFPRMYNLSAGFLFAGVIRPLDPAPPEHVALRVPARSLKTLNAISHWNMLWEAAQFRRRFFDQDDLPKPMATLADLGDSNITFIPRTRSRYYEYAPLLHLLPTKILDRFGLPLVRAGQWPFIAEHDDVDALLPADFEQRLARAWAWAVWRDLISGSPMSAFSANDPIRLLAHNLEFWIPAVTHVIQDRLREFPEVDNGKPVGPVTLVDGSILPGAFTGNPRMGGEIWHGEVDARDALSETVQAADRTGRLRDILDAVRSHRVEDDFTDRWSPAREDFERKLYSKRRKAGAVRFVELPDTMPVQGPDSDIIGNLVTNDFMALLDTKNRQIVVLLTSGMTSRTDIAKTLGYANHSAISKRLNQIRRQAAAFFDAS